MIVNVRECIYTCRCKNYNSIIFVKPFGILTLTTANRINMEIQVHRSVVCVFESLSRFSSVYCVAVLKWISNNNVHSLTT